MSKKRLMIALAIILLFSIALAITVNMWLSERKENKPKNPQIFIKSKNLAKKLAYYKNKFSLKRVYG